jgi:hypothetical protein
VIDKLSVQGVTLLCVVSAVDIHTDVCDYVICVCSVRYCPGLLSSVSWETGTVLCFDLALSFLLPRRQGKFSVLFWPSPFCFLGNRESSVFLFGHVSSVA